MRFWRFWSKFSISNLFWEIGFLLIMVSSNSKGVYLFIHKFGVLATPIWLKKLLYFLVNCICFCISSMFSFISDYNIKKALPYAWICWFVPGIWRRCCWKVDSSAKFKLVYVYFFFVYFASDFNKHYWYFLNLGDVIVYFVPKAFTLLIFVIILMFRMVQQGKEHAHEVHCSRERSKAAWKILEEVKRNCYFWRKICCEQTVTVFF